MRERHEGRWAAPMAAIALTTFFALLYALRGSIAALDSGNDPDWLGQIGWSLVVWWTCLPFLPPLAWLVRKRPVAAPSIATNALLLVGAVLVAAYLRHVLLTPVVVWITGVPATPGSAVARTLTYFTVFFVMVALLHAVYWFRAAADRERRLGEARLQALRAQLQPHFVFNVLNAVTALMHEDTARADRMLTRFGEMLRPMLRDDAADVHPLKDEILLLERYVELMQLRHDDRVTVTWAIDGGDEVPVPFMVLQPLVENAYEHGLAPDRRGTIHISTTRRGDHMELAVEDDGPGFRETAAGGLGLRNTRERLSALYGRRGNLTVMGRDGGGTRAVVVVPA